MLSNEAKSLIHLNIIPGIGLQTTRTLINVWFGRTGVGFTEARFGSRGPSRWCMSKIH